MWEALQYDFMRNALLAGFLVSISCGIIGSLVVVNRIVFISGGIAHAAFGGVGLGFFCGFSPFLGAAVFASGVSLIMGAVSLKARHRADTIIGVLWAIGMAIGIILIDLTPRLSRGSHELPIRQHSGRTIGRSLAHAAAGWFHIADVCCFSIKSSWPYLMMNSLPLWWAFRSKHFTCCSWE